MDKRCIFSPNGPPAQGPYSHAVAAGGFLFVSGMGPIKADGSGVFRGTFEEEARLALSNLEAVLEDAGASLKSVVKVTVFLTNMDNYAVFNEVYQDYFTKDYPARTCVQAARLPMDIQVEVEAVAVLDS
jgi:2-iminobutanoate/2-iminopropanoate deaminase